MAEGTFQDELLYHQNKLKGFRIIVFVHSDVYLSEVKLTCGKITIKFT